jgi:hypothetical protein
MHRFKHLAAALVSVATVCGTGATTAQAASLINFENVPNAQDNLSLTGEKFNTGFGYLTFGIDNDGDGKADAERHAFLEAAGGPRDEGDEWYERFGFVTDVASGKPADIDVDPNSDLGDYFLRTAGIGGGGGALLITYEDGLAAIAEGELWGYRRDRRQDD